MYKPKFLIFLIFLSIAMISLSLFAQESLQKSLEEEEEYYNNFGVIGYSKKEIEQQKIPYYDLFGRHIVNGYLIYGLETERNKIFDSDDDAFGDSTTDAYSNMFQTSLVAENFNNLIITKDALGDMKSVFLVGSQIHTRFTPLTMNKLNFQGVRWDIWTPVLKFSTLVSRTRPFIISQNDVSGRSYVGYDRADMMNWQGVKSGELLPDEEYIDLNWAATEDDFPQRRDGWILNYDKWNDYSNKSVYGDYDILWGFHGKTNIANVADVGVSYLNHHRSDIKKGEKIFSGDLPDDYAPEEIHFEIYDLTPGIISDPGAKVHSIIMTINGENVGSEGQGTVYSVKDDLQIVPSNLRVEISGDKPLIVVFNVALAAKRVGGLDKVKRVDFTFTVAGNYLVFVSTDKLVSLGFSAERLGISNEVAIDFPFTRKIEDLARDKFQPYDDVTTSENNPIGGPSTSGKPFTKFGNSWFGDYIAKSPRIIHAPSEQKEAVYETTRRTYEYSYSINSASVTYGIDFNGKILGVKFNGEVAVNRKDFLYPGGDELDPIYRVATYLSFDRNIFKKLLGIKGMVYNVDPEYDPAMDIPMVSQHFSYSRLYTRYSSKEEYSIPDYLFYPQHFNNNFHLLDDNDDGDLYVENDRLVYPSDLGSGNALNLWHSDGTFHSYKAASRVDRKLHRKANYTYLPNQLYMFYGDEDGVYVDKYDHNRNGLVDYNEDFYLYEADPPIFSLDNDADNNGIWDVEQDDPYPDLPNGVNVSYVLTANGWKSQGIRGLNFRLVSAPVKTLELSTTFLYEKAIDLDFNKYSDDNIDESSSFLNDTIGYENGNGADQSIGEEFQDSRSLGLKGSALLNVVKRRLGLEYFAGIEGQYLQDNIRNDAIRLQEIEDIEYLYYDYYYQTDELRFRQAAVSNLIAGVTYTNIPNFLYNTKISLGGIKRLSIEDQRFYVVRTLRSQAKDTTYYEFRYEPYEASLVKRLYLVNKFDYMVKFDFDFKGWMKAFNLVNRLVINPQYKFSWSLSSSDAVADPRENYDPNRFMTDEETTNLRLDWARYRLENENMISSVPILRLFYKIAENTEFQYGVQWKRAFDQMIREESSLRKVHTFQMYSTDNVAGYNVVLILGLNLIDNDYDILKYDETFENGHLYDGNDTRFFIKVYAGN